MDCIGQLALQRRGEVKLHGLNAKPLPRGTEGQNTVIVNLCCRIANVLNMGLTR